MVVATVHLKSREHEELQELLRRQTVLTRFGELALSSESLDEILTEACRLVGEALGTDLAKVVEVQEDGTSLLVRAGVGWKPGVVGHATISAAEDTSEAHALKTYEPMTSPNIATEKRFRYPRFLIDNGVQAVASVIILGGKNRSPFGILQIDSRTPRLFTDSDISFLRSYANLLAAAVDRLRVLAAMRQGDARLRESEARLAHAIAAAGMSTWEWDANSGKLRFSPGFEELHGQAVGTLQSLEALHLAAHSGDRPVMITAFDQALRGEGGSSFEVDFRVELSNGTLRWLRTTGNAEHDDNGLPTRLAGVTQDITISRNAESRVSHMARHDNLTGLLNGLALRGRLEEALLRSQRGEGCAVLALDLDRFKEVNDTLGHAVGDAVLRSVACRLLEVTRETDVVARPGGDEFVIVQSNLCQSIDAETLATRIIARLSEPYEIDGHRISTGVSIGIAVAPVDGTEADQVLRCADLALYSSKRRDGTRLSFFEVGMQERAQTRRHLVADLRQALARGEFELHYQPLVEFAQGQIIGFEALVRWRHPTRGLVMPGEFIPLAEETGLIVPLGEWVLFRACGDAAVWPSEMKVAVNLSVVQFSKGDLLGTVAAALDRAGLMPRRLDLEITESLLLSDTEATMATLRKLREYGTSISMDDFGVGYSSLSYISKFPFDKVKVDRPFTANAGHDTRGSAIIRAVADLGRSLGMITTAEGIETLEQMQQVIGLGCSEGQGYFFSRPRPREEIPALLSDWSQPGRSVLDRRVKGSALAWRS